MPRKKFNEVWPKGTIVKLNKETDWYSAYKGARATLVRPAWAGEDDVMVKWDRRDDKRNGQEDGIYERSLFTVVDRKGITPINELSWATPDKKKGRRLKEVKFKTTKTSSRVLGESSFEAPLMIRRGKIID